MIISPFTPLFFSPSTDKFGAKSKYVQLFARTDRIFVELILTAKEQEPIVYINNLLSNISTPVSLSSWKMNDDKILYFYNISLLPCGYYTVTVNGNTSEIFKVTDDECELSETSLIQYSMKDNKQRLDAVWWIDGMQYFFDFRVPGVIRILGKAPVMPFRKFESVYDSDAYPEDVRYEYVALEELTTRFRISFNYQLEKMPDNAQRDVILDIIHKHKDYLTSLEAALTDVKDQTA